MSEKGRIVEQTIVQSYFIQNKRRLFLRHTRLHFLHNFLLTLKMFPNIEDKLNLDFSVGFSIASLPSQRNAEKHFFIQIRIYFIF